ncbi:hypothetical protein BLL42_06640 [Pseudomonas frederiksbergensis]|uniref:Uncharacterized protein n=1 Tax=Pseudomonas frederiksbergensis TaxID=104087 RepID=A0A1J0EH26_9PSED|nr:hypothetical protein [Pseudomonas frederiksbergensis]APC15418.1 hypothetical protein BLL42_06640 [Pseudomonas frederiksbergensis]
MSNGRYPSMRVFTVFVLCPLLTGFVVGIVALIVTIFHLVSNPRLLGEVRGAESMLVLVMAPLMAELVFIIPFSVFGFFVVVQKVRKTASALRAISIIGGSVASLWGLLIILVINGGGQKTYISGYGFLLVAVFFVAMLFTGFSAYFVLPEKNTISVLERLKDKP